MFLDKYFSIFKGVDWPLIVALLFLVFFGLSAIYSVALGQGLGEFLNFQKQIIWLIVGLCLLLLAANIDYHYWQRFAWLGYILSLVLLILVLTPLGATIRGTRGWFSLGLFNFQPVELAKIFVIMVLSSVYGHYIRTINRFSQLVFISAIPIIPFLLVMLQPDLGSGLVLFFTWFLSLFLIVKRKWHLALIIFLLVAVSFVGWSYLLIDYQKDRILTFIDPSLDPLGSGYNVRQSLIAVGAGRLFGRGLGFGSQSQLKFIPESQTDFIFAVIAEEMGFIGVLFIIGFFMIIFYRLYRIAIRAPDDFGMFLSLFIMILFFIHVFVNIGMGIGLLPVTGISLPFVSYGGSFLLISCFLIGIALNVNKLGSIYSKNESL